MPRGKQRLSRGAEPGILSSGGDSQSGGYGSPESSDLTDVRSDNLEVDRGAHERLACATVQSAYRIDREHYGGSNPLPQERDLDCVVGPMNTSRYGRAGRWFRLEVLRPIPRGR